MKRKNITLILCLFMTLMYVKADPDPNFHIYLCWGQSNMEGNAQCPQSRGTDDRFQMLYTADNCSQCSRKKGQWYPAQSPLARCFHHNGIGYGPVESFGKTMIKNLDENIKVGVVVVACGGCDIELFEKDKCQAYISRAADWLQGYCREYGGNPYERLIEMAKEAQKVGVIKGILVHQGENNSGQTNWPSRLKGVYETMLSELGLNAADVPLLVGEVRHSGPCSGHNSVIKNVPTVIPTGHVISSEGCEAANDQYHFTVKGYDLLGERYAETMLKLLPKSSEQGQQGEEGQKEEEQQQETKTQTEELLTGVTTGKYVDLYIDNRQTAVYAPNGAHTNRPLLISCHGMNQDINYQRNETRWEQVADTADFIVAYPSSVGSTWDISGSSDTDYLIDIIKELSKTYKIDETRVYMSGFSMGGMLTYHCMNTIPDYFAAFAPISGFMSAEFNPATRPVPLIHTHGTGDDVVTYADFAGVGAEGMVDGWQKHNKCTKKTVEQVGNCCTRTAYTGGECDADVVLMTVAGRGHIPANDNCLHTSRTIWEFVRNYSTGCGKYKAQGVSVSTVVLSDAEPGEVQITASVVGDINIQRYEIYVDDKMVSTEQTYVVSDLEAGSHTIMAIGYDASNKEYKSSKKNISIFEPQKPYNGTPAAIPGKIKAIEFDYGGEGNAYHDNDEQNRNEGDRNEGVDMNNNAVGYTQTGEWFEFTVDVETSGTYEVEAYAASGANGSQFTLYMDNEFIIPGSQGTPGGFIDVPNTGSWDDFVTIKSPLNKLSKGTHILKVEITGDWVDLDYLDFKLIESDETGYEPVLSGISLLNGEFYVYDVTGKQVKKATFVSGKTDELDPGFYIVKDTDGRAYSIVIGK